MPLACALEGDTVVPDPTNFGWNIKDIAVIYNATPMHSLSQIYERLTGETAEITTVKGLSDRSGRPVIVLIEEGMLRIYTPQTYQTFSPVVLTHSTVHNFFGMKVDIQTHHDYISFLCAYTTRIQNVADVAKALVYPYITAAKKATSYEDKMQFLCTGHMKLKEVASTMDKSEDFKETVINVLQQKKKLAEDHAICMLKQKFTRRKLSKIDREGTSYAEVLSKILSDHGGDTKLANDLQQASMKASRDLDTITTLAQEQILTDQLLATMKNKTQLVTEAFNRRLSPHNFSVENDIYPWTSIHSMESGNVIDSYTRHNVLHQYNKDKRKGQKGLSVLVSRKNTIGHIGIDDKTTFETVAKYNDTLQHIENDLLYLTQSSQLIPQITPIKNEITQMIQRGKLISDVVLSLETFQEFNPKSTLRFAVDKIISLCDNLLLQEVFSVKMPQLVTIGQTLHAAGMKNKLQNACLKLTSPHQALVSKILEGNIEEILKVNFTQKTVNTDFLNLQPMGDPNISPFTNAIHEWVTLRTRVLHVAQKMTKQMVKFATFSSADLKSLLSAKLLNVSDYETFIAHIKCWDIIDIPNKTLEHIMEENVKFINVILDEFPDQEDTDCVSLRTFTSTTKLTYTLNENDSIQNAIISNNTYNMAYDFKENELNSVDVGSLACRYTSCVNLRVKDIETLFHYLLWAFEKNDEYGQILYHLSQNNERMGVLSHIVEDHMKLSSEDETDADRVSTICEKYITKFVVPYKANTACLDKNEMLLHVDWTRIDNFLSTSAVLSNIVHNKILQGRNLEDCTVNMEELARALMQHRLYIVTHVGKTLSCASYFPGETNVGCTQEWKNRLIVHLKSKTWNVNIREIIALHKGHCISKTMPLSTNFRDSTFFLAHENNFLVVFYVKSSDPIILPDEWPDSVTFGMAQFKNQRTLQATQHSMKQSANTRSCNAQLTDLNTQLSIAKEGFHEKKGTQIEVEVKKTKVQLNDMHTIIDGIKNMHVSPAHQKTNDMSESHVKSASKADHSTSGHSVTAVALPITVCSEQEVHNGEKNEVSVIKQHNMTFPYAQNNSILIREPRFVKYTAHVNPWKIWRRHTCQGRKVVGHLMQAMIPLPEITSNKRGDC